MIKCLVHSFLFVLGVFAAIALFGVIVVGILHIFGEEIGFYIGMGIVFVGAWMLCFLTCNES